MNLVNKEEINTECQPVLKMCLAVFGKLSKAPMSQVAFGLYFDIVVSHRPHDWLEALASCFGTLQISYYGMVHHQHPPTPVQEGGRCCLNVQVCVVIVSICGGSSLNITL